MIVFKILGLIFMLLIVPMAVGFLALNFIKSTERSYFQAIILGYIASFALLELVGIPVVLLVNYSGYQILMGIYLTALLFTAGLGIYVFIKEILRQKDKEGKAKTDVFMLRAKFDAFKASSVESRIYLIIIVLLVLFQVFMALYMSSYDADDAYYNAFARTAQQYGTLYRTNPNTGRSTTLDMRHGMALIPIFEAIISSVSHIHLLIIVHKVMPIVLIPLSYLIFYEIGKILFLDSREKCRIFLIILTVFRIFGNISEYTTETFFFLRTWQGKAIAGNLIIPMIIYLLLNIMQKKELRDGKTYYVLLGITVIASGACSSLAVLLSLITIALLSLMTSLREKDKNILIKSALACVPGIIYILIYVLV